MPDKEIPDYLKEASEKHGIDKVGKPEERWDVYDNRKFEEAGSSFIAGATSPESARYHQSAVEKGDFNAECYRTACQNRPAVFYNHSTRKYYCPSCAKLINDVNRADAMRLYGHELCTIGYPATPQPVSLTIGSSRFKEWLEETIKTLEAEKEFHGKKERIMARLSALTEVLENYNRWQPVSLEWVKASEPFVKMYNELTESRKRQGGNLYGFNNVWITVEDLANISSLSESGEKGKEEKEIARLQSSMLEIAEKQFKEIERLKGLIEKAHEHGWKQKSWTMPYSFQKFKSENNI